LTHQLIISVGESRIHLWKQLLQLRGLLQRPEIQYFLRHRVPQWTSLFLTLIVAIGLVMQYERL
jgi:hypothetical protein